MFTLLLSRYKYRVAVTMMGIIFIGATASTPLAQSINTRVNGTIRDTVGAVVPGATIALVDVATKREVTTTTNDEGFFVFPDVRSGVYVVTAERQGFKKAEVTNIEVNVDQPATVNIALEAGEIAEVITTTASESQSVVNTENAALGATVQERQINDLPLNGRNPLDLAGLQAGVTGVGDNNREAAINGLRGTFTNLTWDGININDNFIRTDALFGAAGQSVPGVAEFTLTTQNSGPSDGLGVAQVKLVTPRGGSEYHGSLFEYHRNDVFDANSFFNNAASVEKEKLIQNQFGFTIGGPFQVPRFGEGGPVLFGKDKLFFYGFYEGTRVAQSTSSERTVLTQRARQGLFSYRRSDTGQFQTVNLLDLARLRGGGVIDPLVQGLIATTPLPNEVGTGDLANDSLANIGTFRFNSPTNFQSDLYGFRIDFDASARHRFEGIFNQFKFNFPNSGNEPFPGRPGDGQSSSRPRASLAWVWTPTNSLTNEVRGGFFKQSVEFFTDEPFSRGYQLTFPLITDPEDNFLPQGRMTSNYELIDNATYVRGNHLFRFGGNYRRVYVEPFNAGGTLPFYTIAFGTGNPNPLRRAQFPGISTTDFTRATNILEILTAPVDQVDQSFNVTSQTSGFVPGAEERQMFEYFGLGGFAGDTWRVKPNLTLNLGLRYEFISVPKETRGLSLLPRNRELSALFENAVLDFASGGGRPFFNNDLNNFAPSVSFAWDPFGEGKTSIRAGYSISYVIDNNISTVLNGAVRGNDGLGADVEISGVSGTVSGGGIVPVPVPEFQVPRTSLQNVTDISSTAALFTFDPNLRVPYVQQWNIGFEREILPDTVFEIRYVGNRGTKLTRGIDVNQVRIFENGFFADFQRAQRNLAANGDPEVGEGLQILPQIGLGGFLFDSSVRNLIASGQVGQLANFYTSNRSFFLAGSGGEEFDSTIPASFFLPNPNTYVADYYGNGSFSTYNGLQTEIRRRFSRGLYFQANYTFSKAFTDFVGTQSNFQGLLDLTLGNAVEKQRIDEDNTHVFKANALYELPFGPGRRFLDSGGVLGKVLGGWSINGIFQSQSGVPISIVSQRGTLNRTGRSVKNTVDSTLSVDDLRQRSGLFFDAQGRPVLFDPELIAAVRANPDNNAFLTNPRAGTVGSLQLTPVNGPSYFNLDMSLIKRTSITERVNIEFRAEAFNIFNHTNFRVVNDRGQTTVNQQVQSINSANFGRITDTYSPRVLQFAAKFNF